MSTYRFSFPTAIHFGPGVRAQVAAHLESEGLSRPLLVTDRGVAALSMHEELMDQLAAAGLKAASFSGIWGNPVKSQVMPGVRAFKEHQADCIVGLGGGAALDAAKAIALMATHPGDLFDYEDEKPGARPIGGAIPYWVALPTTSGTGSEVGRSSVISDDETRLKKIIFSPKLLARAVFADPELTLDLSAKMTAATGMDALTHCVESYLAKNYHPICDGIALEGVRLAAESLVTCVRKPKDIQARGSLMMASMMGAIAFQKGLGLTHSCAHALGTVADFHHGLANGVMINYALKYNIPAAEDRFRNMGMTIGLKNPSGESFIRWLETLKSETGIPQTLSEAGIKKDQIDRLAKVATEDSCHLNNPRPCTEETFRGIFLEAY